MVKFVDGTLGKISCNFDVKGPTYGVPLHIFGNEGTIKDGRVWSPHKFPGQSDWAEIPTAIQDTGKIEELPFGGMIDHFVDCILQDTETHCNLRDSVNTHEACLAAVISAEENRTVSLPIE